MIFVDTGAWIAVTDASDQYHYQAVKIYALLKVLLPSIAILTLLHG